MARARRDDEGGRERRERRAALGRIHAARERSRGCEQARDEAARLLEDFSERMREMADEGSIGTRRCDDGQDYPQMRLLYWGDIESGSMSMLALEIDYGEGKRARVGVWARLRAIWDCTAFSIGDRARAWARSFSLGSPAAAERAWALCRASLRALSAESQRELDFADDDEGSLDLDLSEADGEARAGWARWVGSQGSGLTPIGAPEPAPPTRLEWAELEVEARMLLDKVRRGLSGASPPAGDEPPGSA